MRLARTVPALAAAWCAACAPGAASPPGSAPSPRPSSRATGPAMLDAITERDLRRDLFALGGDSMRGREAGTLDELRASAWVAERAREAGLEPAGDDGTYFQFWPMRRVVQSAASHLAIGGARLTLGKDVVLLAPADTTIDAPIVFVEPGTTPDGAALRGRVVATVVTPPANAPGAGVSLSARRYATAAIRARAAQLAELGAAAMIFASDSLAETAFQTAGDALMRGRYALDSSAAGVRQGAAAQPPTLWVRAALLDRLRAPGATLTATLRAESYVYPSVNVVARVRGTDPGRRDEYVLFSGHQDHDGVRSPIAGDSIWNGADDNATASVALLAIGRAFVKQPAPRSALFVWHGAEERGLLGSRWYAERPTVPRSAIAAVLNADMIGRNPPDTASLLGSQPPHRNSTALVQMALAANERVSKFAVDSMWDRPSHPEGFYFRSDHLPYARLGVPAIFFTSVLHPDYHTPRDEPAAIDYGKLLRITRWMYATGWAVATAAERPAVDPGFKLER